MRIAFVLESADGARPEVQHCHSMGDVEAFLSHPYFSPTFATCYGDDESIHARVEPTLAAIAAWYALTPPTRSPRSGLTSRGNVDGSER